MAETVKKHYAYILRCADGTFYTGYTTDPERRTRVHNSGKGAKYTRSRRPVTLIHTEEFDDKSEAQKREYAIKQLTRAEKEKLVKGVQQGTEEKLVTGDRAKGRRTNGNRASQSVKRVSARNAICVNR